MKVSPNLVNYQDYYKKINNKVVDIVNVPLIIMCGLIIVFYILFFSGIGNKSGTATPDPYAVGTQPTSSGSGFSIFGFLIVIILIFLIFIGGFKYLFGVDLVTELKKIFSPEPELDINIKTPNKDNGKNNNKNKNNKNKMNHVKYPTLARPEVFHISDNKYTYDDARAVCKAFDSRLATYEEVEKAYNEGGEWCSYGWSNKGLALFPTQKKTYDKLQERRGHENDCGRPGVNGGFIENKNTKFGANCYGIKPEITKLEKKLMKYYNVYPPSKTQKMIDKKSKQYRKELDDILITPFNKDKWSY